VDREVVALGVLWVSEAANACLGLAGMTGLQDQNTQAAEDRTACCTQGQVRSCPVEVHSRGHIVVEGSSRRMEGVEDSVVEKMGTGHDFEAVGLDLGVSKDQDETRSVDQSSVESPTTHVSLISTAY
jgi:hypothetical protein